MTKVYIINETLFGPIFSTLEKAEKYLDKVDTDINWRLERNESGYPDILITELDNKTFIRDR